MQPIASSSSSGILESPQSGPTRGWSFADDAAQQGRVRFLKACDRCRARKVKCDNAMPCSGCERRGYECTFTNSAKRLLHSAARASGSRSPPGERCSTRQKVAKRRADTGVTDGVDSGVKDDSKKQRVLKSDQTTQWFSTGEGALRFAGTTSGLPVLQEARRSMLNMKRTQNNNSSVQDPTWEYLSRLLEISNPHVSDSTLSSTVDDQFFPGRTQNVQGDNAPTSSAYQSVMNNIPRDLLVSLLNLFFKNIHPSWPVLHADYVFARLDSWGDATFGAMIVAMCMLASRYSIDPRVLQDQTDRRSAGMLYVPLFETLLSGGYRNDVYEVAALFFASLFFCTDNIPQPRALKYFATAYAFCIDAGFHRDLPMSCPVEPHEREMRNRIAWALYCYDKFLSTICGRHPWLPLGDIDCDIPQHYPALSGLASHSTLPDAQHTETFNGLIGVSAVLNYALKAVCHRPLYPNSPFLDQLAMRMAKQNTDEEALDEVIDHLGTWKRQLPNRSGRVSVAGEQIATTELVVRLLVSARRLQLAQANNDMNVHQYRPPVVSVAKELINVYVQLGAHNCLHQCSSLDAYKLLLAARLLIACHLGADTAHDEGLKSQCQSALHAAALLLQMLVAMNPVVLGSAEVLFETCRVYQVDIGVPDGFNLFDSPIGSKPWYQPFGRHAPGRSLSPSSRFGTSQSFEQASSSTSENTAASTFHSMVRETHERLATLGESELPDLEYTLDSQIADLDWLFPGP